MIPEFVDSVTKVKAPPPGYIEQLKRIITQSRLGMQMHDERRKRSGTLDVPMVMLQEGSTGVPGTKVFKKRIMPVIGRSHFQTLILFDVSSSMYIPDPLFSIGPPTLYGLCSALEDTGNPTNLYCFSGKGLPIDTRTVRGRINRMPIYFGGTSTVSYSSSGKRVGGEDFDFLIPQIIVDMLKCSLQTKIVILFAHGDANPEHIVQMVNETFPFHPVFFFILLQPRDGTLEECLNVNKDGVFILTRFEDFPQILKTITDIVSSEIRRMLMRGR